ncbi:acetyl-CoA carboxylase biotin carboxylase subunit [Haliangium sp.]|uniref:acetyl-CoA carboxylase biotin carboxylase subunit n=1 Tax=Haliangium sp. TaxID=2663208 RepID=UPI003D0A6B6C
MSENQPRRPLRRVLVANRGEIAVRVMRTCKDRGIETVAVYSDADRLAPHVLMADRAYHIGPPPARESYLDGDKILAVCARAEVDGLHPGYGFLSENDHFSEACAEAGVTFIGPPAAAMRLMGSKTRARESMIAAGVPVVPGDNGPGGNGFPDVDAALAAARAIGFPVLIKASAGGGGKGMRLVTEPGDFAAAFDGARREAAGAFGDDTVYVEKAIIRPRHVEIQVFADTHGNVVHLGERDCSLQRRHQKVVEETPSPAVDAALRARMGASAVAAARACDYVGAGTVEFLLAADGSYYFLEMNTRLQVEHPITEAIYDVDLVGWQLDVAAGAPLPMTQDELDARRRGAAIECRVYAEDPLRFLPSTGTITHLRVPTGPNVRDDSGVYEGSEISMYYDPMISKLVTWGSDRAQALGRMRRALSEYVVRGIQTNLPFHRRVLTHQGFCAGDYDTGFIGREHDAIWGDDAEAAPAEPDQAGPTASGDLAVGLIAAAIDRVERTPQALPELAPEAGVSAWRLGLRAGPWGRGR